jgi:hypothetical protein
MKIEKCVESGKCNECGYEVELVILDGRLVTEEHGHGGEPCHGEHKPAQGGSHSKSKPN